MEKTIDGIKFSVAPFQVTEALRLKSYLLKKFGPSLGQLLGVLQGGLPENASLGDIKLDGEVVSHAIEKLMEHLGEEEFESFIKRMFRNVSASLTKDGAPLLLSFSEQAFSTSMDIVFTGRLFTIYPVLLLVLEANYPDFFGKMAQGFGSKIQKILTSEPAGQSSKSETAS